MNAASLSCDIIDHANCQYIITCYLNVITYQIKALPMLKEMVDRHKFTYSKAYLHADLYF